MFWNLKSCYLLVSLSVVLGLFRKKSPFFSLRFHRKLTRKKTQQGMEKVRKLNRRTVSSWIVVLCRHQQDWCQPCLIIYTLFIALTHKLRQLTFLPPPPQPIECVATDRVRRTLSLGRRVKAYDRVAPQPLNDADMTMMEYPTVSELSANQCASGNASIIATSRLQQPPPPP